MFTALKNDAGANAMCEYHYILSFVNRAYGGAQIDSM